MFDIKTEKILIVDLEATCWNDQEHPASESEIIEIGAVISDMNSKAIIDEFQGFVLPIRHPQLSEFCKSLTSISQGDVDNADIFPTVWHRFLEWVGSVELVTLASWGAYDHLQMQKDCSFHKLEYPFAGNHLNLKAEFGKLHGGRKFGMKRALHLLGLPLEGIHHRGIDDARNIFRIWVKMQELSI